MVSIFISNIDTFPCHMFNISDFNFDFCAQRWVAILGLNMDKGFVPIFFNFFMRFKFLQYRIIIDNLYFLRNVNVYRGLRGVHRFSLQYLWKRAVRITEKPYIHQRERLCMLWGNRAIFTDCGEIL